MSADNGWLLRRNELGQFVMQMYSLSSDFYPAINDPRATIFKNLGEAIRWYELEADESEYGLRLKITTVTPNPPLRKE